MGQREARQECLVDEGKSELLLVEGIRGDQYGGKWGSARNG